MLQDGGSRCTEKFDRKSPITFFSKIFKWKPLCKKNNRRLDTKKCMSYSTNCIPTASSPASLCILHNPPSPALSIPSRNKNVDHDMLALRLSRQDDPFLKVLASKESLAESCLGDGIAEADDIINNSSQCTLSDLDPLNVPEFHKHMVRSPPPVTWSKSPVFKFDDSSQESLMFKAPERRHFSRDSMVDTGIAAIISPSLSISKRYNRSSSAEAKERRCNSTFSLMPPSSFRSLSEVRRMHIRSCEESQCLVPYK